MNDTLGFFPERAALAAVRVRQAAAREPVSVATRNGYRWVVFAALTPVWITPIGQLFSAYIRPGHVPVALFAVMYGIAGLALAGTAIGIWRGLHTRVLSTVR